MTFWLDSDEPRTSTVHEKTLMLELENKDRAIKMLEQKSGLNIIPCPRCNQPKIAQDICGCCAAELGISDEDVDRLAGDYAGTMTY